MKPVDMFFAMRGKTIYSTEYLYREGEVLPTVIKITFTDTTCVFIEAYYEHECSYIKVI